MACKHDDGPQHNCGYVTRVNALIIVASFVANEKVKQPERSAQMSAFGYQRLMLAYDRRWSLVFHAEMDRLTSEAGLRQPLERLRAVA